MNADFIGIMIRMAEVRRQAYLNVIYKDIAYFKICGILKRLGIGSTETQSKSRQIIAEASIAGTERFL